MNILSNLNYNKCLVDFFSINKTLVLAFVPGTLFEIKGDADYAPVAQPVEQSQQDLIEEEI